MRYQRVEQKKYCCVAACLEMIFKSKGCDFDQVDIAYDLGLIVPEDDLAQFPDALTGEKPGVGWGTQIQKEKYSLWGYLEGKNIDLELEFFSCEKVTIELLKKWYVEKCHIMVLMNYPKLYELAGNWGHASLIHEVLDETVALIDPSSKHTDIREVSLEKLVNATKSNTRLGWGFWVFQG